MNNSISNYLKRITICRDSMPVIRIVNALDRHWRLNHFNMKPGQWVELSMTIGKWKGKVLSKRCHVSRKKYPNRRKKFLTNYRMENKCHDQ